MTVTSLAEFDSHELTYAVSNAAETRSFIYANDAATDVAALIPGSSQLRV